MTFLKETVAHHANRFLVFLAVCASIYSQKPLIRVSVILLGRNSSVVSLYSTLCDWTYHSLKGEFHLLCDIQQEKY